MSIACALASAAEAGSSLVSEVVAEKFFSRTRDRLCNALEAQRRSELAQQLRMLPPARFSPWRPEVGMAARFCDTGNPELGALQLMMVAEPHALAAIVILETAGDLLADGWSVPVAGETTLTWESDELILKSDRGTMRYERSNGRLVPVGAQEGHAWNVAPIRSSKPYTAIQSGLTGSSGVFPWPSAALFTRLRDGTQNQVKTAMHDRNVERSLEIIAESSPRYVKWISDVIDSFMLTASQGLAVSSPDFPGLVALGPMTDDLDYVEVLVSHACQQRLFQHILVAPITESGREEVHYLPSQRSYVTTRRTLAAAHAHANVLSVLKDIKSDPKGDKANRIARRTLLFRTTCTPVLEHSRQLTEAGAMLWSRIREVAEV